MQYNERKFNTDIASVCGITLTEDQAMEMTKVLVRRYRARAERSAKNAGKSKNIASANSAAGHG